MIVLRRYPNIVLGVVTCFILQASAIAMSQPKLLTDPFLQLPTQTSVRVVWFTEFAGSQHHVQFGKDLEQTAIATTTKLTKVRDDQDGAQPVTYRGIWRHEAEVQTTKPLPYRVKSTHDSGEMISSDRFTLAPSPKPGAAKKILLTSDHQLKSMTPANLQKVVETLGSVDAVFFAGDLVNIPDRASEWFDQDKAFFPSLQGKASSFVMPDGPVYRGGAIIQSAPIFPAIGNHEVMGRFSMDTPLNQQYSDPVPRQVAMERYHQRSPHINPNNDPQVQASWIKDHSFNTDTYEEIFSLPTDSPGAEKYYAVTWGDVRLISLYLTRIWRSPNPKARGRYQEKAEDLNASERWGYGAHIFEAIAPGSAQYEWLKAELQSSEFQQAPYKVVMFHHPPHSLGQNVVPAFTDPIQRIERSQDGQIQSVRYEYPQEKNLLTNHVLPLLEAADVQLVLYGHTHLWNRFISPSGLHFLESSNVGNSYGAYPNSLEKTRILSPYFSEAYGLTGNPYGLSPVIPTIAPLKDEQGQDQPYIASNDITVFSVLDTGSGTVSSYRFDTRAPASPAIKFDEFHLKASRASARLCR